MTARYRPGDPNPVQLTAGCIGLLLIAMACFASGIWVGRRWNDDSQMAVSPAGAACEEKLHNLDMVRLPPGHFAAGPPEGWESQGHGGVSRNRQVVAKPFWIGQHEVTKWEWEQVMGTRPWAGRADVLDDPDTPAVYVSYHDATAFCNRLSMVTGEAWRLPTGPEWEYAARAGSKTHYCFGDGCWSDESLPQDPSLAYIQHHGNLTGQFPGAQRVGQLLPNTWGLLDVHGNVREWCAPGGGGGVAARGGAWNQHPDTMMVWLSVPLDPLTQDALTGFRVLREETAGHGSELFQFLGTPEPEEWRERRAGTNGFPYHHPLFAQAHNEPISAIAISPDGTRLATTAWDSTVKLWDLESRDKMGEHDLGNMIWHAMALSPGGRFVAFGDAFKMMEDLGLNGAGFPFVHVLDTESQETVLERDAGDAAFAFSPGGKWFALLAGTEIELYDTQNWEEARTLLPGPPAVLPLTAPALAFSDDASQLTLLDPNLRRTFDIARARVLVSLANGSPVSEARVALTPRPPFLVVGMQDGLAGAWQYGPEQVLELPMRPPWPFGDGPMCITPNGRYLAVASPDGWIDLLSIPLFTRLKRFPVYAEGLAATPDSRYLVAHGTYHVFRISIEGPAEVVHFRDATPGHGEDALQQQ